MRSHLCPLCEREITRVAVLAVQLRKVSAIAHRLLSHPTATWQTCAEEPCLSTWRKLNLTEATRVE
jgi:hypothetical protein